MGYFLVALEVIPADNLSRFLQSLERGRLSHQRKQALSFIAACISEFQQRLNLAVDDRLGSKGDRTINPGDSQTLRVELLVILKSMAPDLNSLFEEPSLESEVEAVFKGSWQTLRDRGFYVDFVDGVIRTPREIDEPATSSALERLQKTLRVVLPLTRMDRWPDSAISIIKGLLPKTEAEMEALWPKPEPQRPTVDGNGLPAA